MYLEESVCALFRRGEEWSGLGLVDPGTIDVMVKEWGKGGREGERWGKGGTDGVMVGGRGREEVRVGGREREWSNGGRMSFLLTVEGIAKKISFPL